MGGWRLLLVVSVAAAAAGCVDSGVDNDATGFTESSRSVEPGNQTASIPVVLDSCENLEVLTQQSSAEAAEFVPGGFEVLDSGGLTTVIIGWLACDGTDSVERAFLAIEVTPLDSALEQDGIERYFWEPEHAVVAGSFVDAAYDDLGSNQSAARTFALDLAVQGTSASHSVDQGEHSAQLDGAVLPSPGIAGAFGSFREYSQGHGGFVYLEAAFAALDDERFGASTAHYETAPRTPARALLGASGQGAALAGALVYAEASVGFVPWPAAA